MNADSKGGRSSTPHFRSFNAGNASTTFIISMLTVMMLWSRFRMYFRSLQTLSL